jgi:DNA-nicking Smr family endonuclease
MPEKKPPKNRMSKNRPRTPNATEQQLWETATKGITPITARTVAKITPQPTGKRERPKGDTTGRIILETLKPITTPKPRDPSSYQLDNTLNRKLVQGDLPIDGKIDLHGLTLHQAHARFMAFFHQKQKAGARLLLIVTGKGPSGEGVIRKNLPLWCDDHTTSPHILKTTAAAAHHGGSGATYILLRRSRQKPT